MKIEKYIGYELFYHYISKTSAWHGLYNERNVSIGYQYHDQKKGFYLRKIKI
jgi:hypothetical protein